MQLARCILVHRETNTIGQHMIKPVKILLCYCHICIDDLTCFSADGRGRRWSCLLLPIVPSLQRPKSREDRPLEYFAVNKISSEKQRRKGGGQGGETEHPHRNANEVHRNRWTARLPKAWVARGCPFFWGATGYYQTTHRKCNEAKISAESRCSAAPRSL